MLMQRPKARIQTDEKALKQQGGGTEHWRTQTWPWYPQQSKKKSCPKYYNKSIKYNSVNWNLQVPTCHLSMSTHPMLWIKGPKTVVDTVLFQQRCKLILLSSNNFLRLGLSLMHTTRDLLYCREGPLGSFWIGPAQRTYQNPFHKQPVTLVVTAEPGQLSTNHIGHVHI